jgi:hypothetical protein
MSSDGATIIEFMFVLYGALIVAGVALLNGIAVLVRRICKPNVGPLTYLADFGIHSLVLVLVFADVVLHIGFRVRFNMSRAAFESAARDIRAGKRIATPTSIGYYRVSEIKPAH